MLAARLSAPRQPLELVEMAPPAPPEGGVVLRVLATGVCRSDWHVWCGVDPDVDWPITPGHEYCGEVVAVGAGVTRWAVGDRVIAPFILACGACPACAAGQQTTCARQVLPGFTCDGAFASHIAVAFADTNLTALPGGMDPALAAALGCRATTAWQALTTRAAVQGGEWVAVFGAGGVGLSTLLLARALGARVAMVDVVAERLDYAAALGADVVIDARDTDPAQAVRDATGGGAHVAIEALGVTETTAGALKCLRKLGRAVMVGMPAGDHTTMALPMDALYSGQLTLMGTRGMPAHRYPSLLRLIDGGHVDLTPLIARRVALSDATAELAAFDAPAAPGVAVITDFTR